MGLKVRKVVMDEIFSTRQRQKQKVIKVTYKLALFLVFDRLFRILKDFFNKILEHFFL